MLFLFIESDYVKCAWPALRANIRFSPDDSYVLTRTLGLRYNCRTMAITEPAARKKKTSPCDPWKRKMYAEFLDGEHRITVLAERFGHSFRVVKNAIASEKAALAEITGDVETAKQRYIERLRFAEGLAEELWETSTGNARTGALKSIIKVAELLAAANGVATVREAGEHEAIEDFMRNLIAPSMTKAPLDHRN